MNMTITRFHARFTSPEPDRLIAGLRRLRRLADLPTLASGEVEPMDVWTVWAVVEQTAAEAPASCAA